MKAAFFAVLMAVAEALPTQNPVNSGNSLDKKPESLYDVPGRLVLDGQHPSEDPLEKKYSIKEEAQFGEPNKRRDDVVQTDNEERFPKAYSDFLQSTRGAKLHCTNEGTPDQVCEIVLAPGEESEPESSPETVSSDSALPPLPASIPPDDRPVYFDSPPDLSDPSDSDSSGARRPPPDLSKPGSANSGSSDSGNLDNGEDEPRVISLLHEEQLGADQEEQGAERKDSKYEASSPEDIQENWAAPQRKLTTKLHDLSTEILRLSAKRPLDLGKYAPLKSQYEYTKHQLQTLDVISAKLGSSDETIRYYDEYLQSVTHNALEMCDSDQTQTTPCRRIREQAEPLDERIRGLSSTFFAQKGARRDAWNLLNNFISAHEALAFTLKEGVIVQIAPYLKARDDFLNALWDVKDFSDDTATEQLWDVYLTPFYLTLQNIDERARYTCETGNVPKDLCDRVSEAV